MIDNQVNSALLHAFASKPTLVERVKESSADVQLHYFSDMTEWLVMLLLVGIRHAVPTATSEEAAEIARFLASRIYQPGQRYLWQFASNWVDRRGIEQAARRVINELTLTAQSAERSR